MIWCLYWRKRYERIWITKNNNGLLSLSDYMLCSWMCVRMCVYLSGPPIHSGPTRKSIDTACPSVCLCVGWGYINTFCLCVWNPCWATDCAICNSLTSNLLVRTRACVCVCLRASLSNHPLYLPCDKLSFSLSMSPTQTHPVPHARTL